MCPYIPKACADQQCGCVAIPALRSGIGATPVQKTDKQARPSADARDLLADAAAPAPAMMAASAPAPMMAPASSAAPAPAPAADAAAAAPAVPPTPAATPAPAGTTPACTSPASEGNSALSALRRNCYHVSGGREPSVHLSAAPTAHFNSQGRCISVPAGAACASAILSA